MDIFDRLIFDPEKIRESMDRDKAERKADPRICICGHSARSHSSLALKKNIVHASFREAGVERCYPGTMACPCEGFRAVLKASDVRRFLFKTSGSYNEHALAKGILNARERGQTLEPVGSWDCDRCGGSDRVGPVAVNREGMESSEPERDNYLLCALCVLVLRSGETGSSDAGENGVE